MRGRSCCDSRRGANASQSGSRSLVSCRSPPEASPFLIERFPGRFEAEPRPESRSAPAQDARLSPCRARCWEEQSVSRGRSPARGGRLPLTPRPRPRTTPPISLSKDRGHPFPLASACTPDSPFILPHRGHEKSSCPEGLAYSTFGTLTLQWGDGTGRANSASARLKERGSE